MCANARNHRVIPMNSFFRLRRHSGHELVLGKSNLGWLSVKFCTTYPSVIRASASDPSFWRSNSFELKRRIIQMLLSSDAFAFLLPMVGCWYSHQFLCWPPDLLVGCYLQLPRVLICWRISPDTKCLWQRVSSTPCRQPSAFELVSLDYDVCCMGFKMPRWFNPMLPLTCMNPIFMWFILYWPSVRWACNTTTSPKARSEC